MDLSKLGGNEWKNLSGFHSSQQNAIRRSPAKNFLNDAQTWKYSDSIDQVLVKMRSKKQRQFLDK
jgi:hypothetical protein